MKINKKKVLYGLFLAGMVFIIYKNTTLPTNNADKYFQEYFEGVKLLPAIIDEPYKLDMENQFEAICYKRGFSILGYKARLGTVETMCKRY